MKKIIQTFALTLLAISLPLSSFAAQQTLTNSAGMLTKANQNFTELYGKTSGVSVDTYGAVGNGSTDDTVAVQACLTAASTDGLTCILTTGKTYKITSELYLWGRANLFSWQTTSTTFGSLRFTTGTKKYLVNIGISGSGGGAGTPQEPWSGTIKNCDFTMVSGSGQHRIIFFWRTNSGTITGNTGEAGVFQYSLTSSGNDATILDSAQLIRKNITITDNVWTATGSDHLGSEGIGLGNFDGAYIARNRVVGVGDDPIGVHFSRNVVIAENVVTSVDGRIFVSNCVDCKIRNNTATRSIGGTDGVWHTGVALIYVGHEAIVTNSNYAPTNNVIANNLLIYPSGAVDAGAAIQLIGSRQSSIVGNTIINNSATTTGVGISITYVAFGGAVWTDPTGIDPTTTANSYDTSIIGNVSAGAYPLGFQQAGSSSVFKGSFVVANNAAKNFGFYAPTERMIGSNNSGPTVTIPYSASMTIDASQGSGSFQVTVTDTSAMTINAPANSTGGNQYPIGSLLTFMFKNTSGGAMGTITWNSVFSLAGAFVNPATTKNRSITFINNSIPGSSNNWRELYRTAADVAN